MHIDENVILGLDIGVGSIGWVLVRENPETLEKHIVSRILPSGEIRFAMGSRVFRVPEDAKTKELLNVRRRAARQQRRVVHRRAQRMRKVRRLLSENGIPQALDADMLHLRKGHQHNPWALRKAALERLLSPEELAVVLLHMAKHRGFKSNSKNGGNDQSADAGKMLAGVHELRERCNASGTTVGAYLADQPRKRNYKDFSGQVVYANTIARALLEDETDVIFAAQHSFGSVLATAILCDAYKELAFTQRPLASVADMVGECTLLAGEKRAPACAPSAERFRLAQRLTILRLRNPDGTTVPLNREQIEGVLALQGKQAKISYKTVRKLLKLAPTTMFDGIGQDNGAENADIVRRTGASLEGSAKLAECLGAESYERLYSRLLGEAEALPGARCLDYIAKIFSENDDLSFILEKLAALNLDATDHAALCSALKAGRFASFRGTMRLSLKAIAVVLPRMLECGGYAEALADLDLEEQRDIDTNSIRNPVVQHVLRETRKQTAAIMRDWNLLPGRVHVELLREVGKSAEERNKIDKGIRDRTAQKSAMRAAAAEAFGIREEDVSSTELKRYELWQAQEGKCAYYMLWRNLGGGRHYQGPLADGHIPVQWLRDGENAVQIDHILPHSRTFDNSFHNLCLCCTSANQAKSGKTPYEWLGKSDASAWHEYTVWVQSLHIKGLKKRNFLLQNLDAAMQDKFHARNLTDSSYAARLVSRWFEELYDLHSGKTGGGERKRRVFARPGGITNFLRVHWGLQRLKKDAEGKRLEDDRHHAIDALVVACCTEGQLQRITRLLRQGEQDHSRVHIPLPGDGFVSEAENAYAQVFVSRSEQRTRTGALHEETLRAIRTEQDNEGGQKEVLYERKFIANLTQKDLPNIKDPHRCPDVVAALGRWLALSKKEKMEEANLPRSAHGDIIRHVSVRRGDFTSGVRLKRGSGVAQADNAEMVRTDVYTRKGKFYLVPVYIKQLADGVLPLKAVVANKPESEWLLMDSSYSFCFSLYKDCYVVTQKGDTVKAGYYMSTNRSVASIALAAMQGRDKALLMTGIGVQQLSRFEKYTVDRLGRVTRVVHEPDPRTRGGGA